MTALALLLLLGALAAPASANLNDDRIAARTACYKACFFSDGWAPVCTWNPKFPNKTTHGGGSWAMPNECTAKCMSQYAKYAEQRNLVVKYKVDMPARCYNKAWQIYINLDVSDPACLDCPAAPSSKRPSKADLTEEQCMIACYDRDGWKPICVRDFTSGKKFAFGNACAARCSRAIFSPTPLYYTNLPNSCKTLFSMGKTSAACQRCPAGKEDPNLFIDDDRVAARTYCYKACISLNGWDPVCMANPKYPTPTPKYSGPSVWPNACTGRCMSQYARYPEYANLIVTKKVTKPKACKDRLWDIWYLDDSEPTAPASLIKRCTDC